MATKALTPKQLEVQTLLKQGKKVPEIAKAMNITPNAVYTHVRGIRDATGRGVRKRTAARPVAPSQAKPPVFATLAPRVTPKAALSQRRGELESKIKEHDNSVKSAEAAAVKARKTAESETAKLRTELNHVIAAQRALSGDKGTPTIRAARRRRRKATPAASNGSGAKAAAKKAAASTAPATSTLPPRAKA